MRRSCFALAFLFAVLVLTLPQVASAKEGLNAFRVVTPSGKVGWVRGQAAAQWWHDYVAPGKRACACSSASAASRYYRRLRRRFSTPLAVWPEGHTAWLLAAITHYGSMLYYPPTPGLPGVVLTPVQGPRAWRYHWEIASPRMQNILRLALQNGTIARYGNSSVFPTGWVVGGGVGAVLVAALSLGAWRRQELRERLAGRLGHPSFPPSP